jgi:hypothetical protein
MNKVEVEKLINEHNNKKQNHTRKLFCLMSLEVWYKNYFKNDNLDKEYDYFKDILCSGLT